MNRLALALAFFLPSGPVYGHDARPVHVRIAETAPGEFEVVWKVPATVAAEKLPRLLLPDMCEAGKVRIRSSAVAYRGSMTFVCSDSLSGHRIGLDYPGGNPSLSALYRVRLLEDESRTKLVGPDRNTWLIPERADFLSVAREYALLGLKHIRAGVDHLLFVACLVFIAAGFRRLVVTVTGFTIAHSFTLALAALDMVRLPTPPVEAVIALSVVFLAREIARRERQSLTYRYPVTVSVSFGLLHGLGFAAVLGEIGLPRTEVVAALLFFNVGVEAGQLLFVLVALGIIRLARRYPWPVARPFALLPVYAIGVTASYWFVERVAAF